MSLEAAADRAHARSAGYQRRRDAALRMIEQAPEGSICSVSWGKDSVALLSLVEQARPEMPVFHYRWPADQRPASLDAVRDACIERYGLAPQLPPWERPGASAKVGLSASAEPASDPRPSHPECHQQPSSPPYLEVPIAGQSEAWYRLGRAWLEPRDAQESHTQDRVRRENGDRLHAAYALLDAKASLIGLRAAESHGRMMHLASRGLQWWQGGWGLDTLAPLGWWSGQDVWARHAECDLPSAAHYHAPGHDRDRVRSEVTFAEAAATWRYGQGQFWAEVDPALWRRLVGAWPEVSRWG